MPMTNGHSSDIDENHLRPSPQAPRSESELSDLNDLPTTTNVSLTPQDDVEPSDDDAIHDMATSELDEDEDAEGEEDAEFDEESPAPEAVHGMRHDRLTSEESVRPSKRKAEVDDEEYMKQNPELYGLRRSVSIVLSLRSFFILTCHCRAGPDQVVEWYGFPCLYISTSYTDSFS